MSTAYLPNIAHGHDGSMLRAWAEYLSGTSGDMRIKVQYRASGDTAWPTAVILLDHLGAEIHCVDGQFGNIEHAHIGDARWTMAIVYTGETAISTWFSTDEVGWTFTRI